MAKSPTSAGDTPPVVEKTEETETPDDGNRTANNDPTRLQLVTSTTKADHTKMDKTCREQLYKKVMRYSEPLNILVVGREGSGKSSFINSSLRAINKKYGEWVTVGLGEDIPNITTTLHRVNMYYPDLNNPRLKPEGDIKAPDGGPISPQEAPHIIDVCGLPDEDNAYVRMVLRLLMYGHFDLDKHNILDIQRDAKEMTPQELLDKYPDSKEELVIHRVIVVTNAKTALSAELIKAVMDTARPPAHDLDGFESKRVIPIFGLMTHVDEVDRENEDFLQKKERFKKLVAVKGSELRFAMVRNYVMEEGEGQEENDPDIDEPILKFLRNVFDPAHPIDNPDWKLKGSGFLSRLQSKLAKHWLVCAGMAGLVLIILLLIFWDFIKVRIEGINPLLLPLCLVVIALVLLLVREMIKTYKESRKK